MAHVSECMAFPPDFISLHAIDCFPTDYPQTNIPPQRTAPNQLGEGVVHRLHHTTTQLMAHGGDSNTLRGNRCASNWQQQSGA
jgi:hypothetical protein